MKASETLQTALDLVTGDRNRQNGAALENHENIALLWTAYTKHKFTPQDVCIMMALMKIARTKLGEHNTDDYVDGAGYLALAGDMASVESDDEVWIANHGLVA